MKLATSVFLYYDNPDANEGSLTKARSEQIGDFNLHLLAETTKIAGKIFSKKFIPTEMWIPPCFTDQSSSTNRKKRMGKFEPSGLRQNECEYLYHRVTQKRESDCVKGLVGSVFSSWRCGSSTETRAVAGTAHSQCHISSHHT